MFGNRQLYRNATCGINKLSNRHERKLPRRSERNGDPIGVAVTGSTATSDLKVWTADPGFGVPVTAALGDNTFPGAYNDLFRYDIGSGPLPWNHAPNFAVNLGLPGFFDILTLDVTVGYDGKLIGMFYRANFSDGCIQVFRLYRHYLVVFHWLG